MDMRLKKILPVLLLLLLCLPQIKATNTGIIIPANPSAVRDSLREELAHKHTAADSVRILYHIYDLQPRPRKHETARELYDVAKRSGDYSTQLDILRQMANIYTNSDSALILIENEANTIPGGGETDETRLFIRLLHSTNRTNRSDINESEERLSELVRLYSTTPPEKITEKIESLYTLCGLLAKATQGKVLEKYLRKLEDLADSIPTHTHVINNLICTRAAVAFSKSQSYNKIIEYDRKLLRIIDSLEQDYLYKGRIYRDYSPNRYTSYRRILGCYPILTRKEVERYYTEILRLAEKNPVVAHDLHRNERATIYYLMGTQQYPEAIEILMRQIDNPGNEFSRPALIEALAVAAKATGDEKAELRANKLYNDILKQRLESKDLERARELQIVYDIEDLKAENIALERKQQKSHLQFTHTVIFFCILIMIVLITVIIILSRQYKKIKKLMRDISDTNRNLIEERDRLQQTREDLIKARDEAKSAEKQKTDFINNISHEIRTPLNAVMEYSRLIVDCVPDEKQKYLNRFVRIIELNSELVLSLVNDVLDISALENNHVSVNIKPVTVRSVYQIALDLGTDRHSDDVEVVLEPDGDPDRFITTDGPKVSQVLINLMSNALKFTEKGKITLAYTFNDDKTITFTVTDTGIGIPQNAQELVFDRFRQIDPSSQGCGLGLYICRLIARLLNGRIYVDRTYKGGARFVFTIPV